MKININNEAIEYLLKLDLTQYISDDQIERLLRIPSFKTMIEYSSGCVNIKNGDFDTWIELFSIGFNNKPIKKKYKNDCAKINIVQAVVNAVSNVDKLKMYATKIVKTLKTHQFVDIAKKYLPKIEDDNELTINLIFGVNNFFAGNQNIHLDVMLLGSYESSFISKFMAHEIHHIFREKIQVKYTYSKEMSNLYDVLSWIESEATANMCNGFIESIQFYDALGYVSSKEIEEMLENPQEIYSTFERLILANSIETKKLSEYLYEKLRFLTMGYFMTCQIISTYGLDKFKSCVGDMKRFFILFQESSKINNDGKFAYVFKEELINLIYKSFIKKDSIKE